MQKEQSKNRFGSSIIWSVLAAVIVVVTFTLTKPAASVPVPVETKPASIESFDEEFVALENTALTNNGKRVVLKGIALVD